MQLGTQDFFKTLEKKNRCFWEMIVGNESQKVSTEYKKLQEHFYSPVFKALPAEMETLVRDLKNDRDNYVLKRFVNFIWKV